MTLGRGLVRDEDGILVWHGGRHYTDPGEAVKTWWAGQTRIGCAERIYANYGSGPCGNVAKHDPDANGNPTRCGHHSAAAKARKEAASAARMSKWLAKRKLDAEVASYKTARSLLSKEAVAAIRRIAAGHNDPRGLAEEVVAKLDALKDPRETQKGE